jgi:hypothetical protein
VTFAEMLANLYDELGFSSSPAAAITTRLKRYLNEGHRAVLRLPALMDARQGTLSFTSTSGQSVYAIPSAFDTIDAIVEQTNNRKIQMRGRDWYRRIDPGESAAGNPQYWIDLGRFPVMRQPASTGLWIVSTAGGDTTQIVKLIGVRANGDRQAEVSATLNGTTRVALGSLTDYAVVERWELATAATGTVSLYDAAASGNELARIPPGETSIQYQQIRLWPTPAATLTYIVDGKLVIPDLVNNTDVPNLPVLFHDMLVVYAKSAEYKRQADKDRWQIAESEWQTWVRKLEAHLEYPADYDAVVGVRDGGYGASLRPSSSYDDGYGIQGGFTSLVQYDISTVLTSAPTSLSESQIWFQTDGGSPETISLYLRRSGVTQGPFPMFTLP